MKQWSNEVRRINDNYALYRQRTESTNPSNSMHQLAYIATSEQYFGSRLADYGAARETIERVAFSEANWDGDGALPISREVKSNASIALGNSRINFRTSAGNHSKS